MNKNLYPIYTNEANCRDCYKCVRVCPVKAIKVKNSIATIATERCTYCGECVRVCPARAKVIRNDVPYVQNLIKNKGKRKVFASLSPSYISEFDKRKDAVLVALKMLGFDFISETSIGDAIVAECIKERMNKYGGKYSKISTSCPSVVELIKKYYPELEGELSDIPSPLQCHAKYLRSLYGDDIIVVYIGPCISKKLEADHTDGYPNASLTFIEFKDWLLDENINLDEIEVSIQTGDIPLPSFVPKKAGVSMLSVLSGGTVASLKGVKKEKPLSENSIFISGGDSIIEVMDTYEKSGYLESLFCALGCINGPGLSEKRSIAKRKKLTLEYVNNRLMEERDIFVPDEDFVSDVLKKGYGILGEMHEKKRDKSIWKKFSNEQVKEALRILGKEKKEDEYNCGGCGYDTCRDLAEAYLAGMAEDDMCVVRARREAEKKVNMLLKTIPMSVLIVDSSFKIVDYNDSFYRMFSSYKSSTPSESNFDFKDKINILKNADLIEIKDSISQIFDDDKKLITKRIKIKKRVLQCTFFEIQKNRLVGVIFDDITTPSAEKEFVVKNARDVINNSLKTVEQIASLLGENAAETEIALNSLIEAFGSDEIE